MFGDALIQDRELSIVCYIWKIGKKTFLDLLYIQRSTYGAPTNQHCTTEQPAQIIYRVCNTIIDIIAPFSDVMCAPHSPHRK